VGHAQTRNRGTIGGSLVHADPAAELPLTAQVLEAHLHVRSARGERTLSAEAFFLGPLATALEADECLQEIEWPIWLEPRTGCAFMEVSRRHGDFAIVAACAQVAVGEDGRCIRAALGLGGGAATSMAFPALAERLIGTRLEDGVLRSVGEDAARELDPAGDLHASAAYRKQLATVLTARVLREAYSEASAKS
jgi:CO/xanthine dehydrogenase FAD-binding subunit